uniref:Uncharacterized protein n=1 Tax=Arundo donax TaxID=35708 RepID=A0A0A9C8G8_ARUDO
MHKNCIGGHGQVRNII